MTDTIYAPYFLVPFGFALAILILELGLVSRSKATMWAGLALPAVLVMLAGIGHSEETAYREFLDLWKNACGRMSVDERATHFRTVAGPHTTRSPERP